MVYYGDYSEKVKNHLVINSKKKSARSTTAITWNSECRPGRARLVHYNDDSERSTLSTTVITENTGKLKIDTV